MRTLFRPFGLVLLLATTAVGADSSPPAATASCAAEIQRFCKDVAPGGGRLRSCLAGHTSELSAECLARMQANRADSSPKTPPMVACDADLRVHCPKVPAGGGRLRACLESHAGQLTAPCKSALARTAKKAP